MSGDYQKFLAEKRRFRQPGTGFKPTFLPKMLKPFQLYLCEWEINLGRGAFLADCGLGKGFMALTVAENVVRHTNKPALILTPLAVAAQFEREAAKFGMEAKKTQDGKVYKGINVTNYHRLGNYNPDDFALVVCDEHSVLKGFDRKWRKQITAFMQAVPYRLLCSATPAPNDFMELGGGSEALGSMTRNQMLAMFFTNDGEITQHWRLKGHAKQRFWRWVASWARACRMPSDLGFSDEGYILPPLRTHRHVLKSDGPQTGLLPRIAVTMDEQRDEMRRSLRQRCEKVASLIPKTGSVVVWCNLNPEGDLLQKLIPGSIQVAGCQKDEEKEERLTAFSSGQARILITKAKVAGFGLNWQHCSTMFYFPTHSHEAFYQAIRRCWRFGQENPVDCHLITTEANSRITENMLRKERQSIEMYAGICREMSSVLKSEANEYATKDIEVPSWLR